MLSLVDSLGGDGVSEPCLLDGTKTADGNQETPSAALQAVYCSCRVDSDAHV